MGSAAGLHTIAEAHAAVARAVREQAGLLTSALLRILGDFGVAEEIVQDALLIALERWPVDGIPDRPGAWLLTVARRLAMNRLARDARYRVRLAQLESEEQPEVDDRLRLIFTCCHPSLARDAQVALTLRTVCGLTTAEIAHAFLATESTVAQRIVRARRKIVDARIPYRVPDERARGERIDEVLSVLYLMFNEGYLATEGIPSRRDLSEDAAWLAALVCRLLPNEPEPKGLLALMQIHLARAEARFDANGEIVLLRRQDRTRWNRALIQQAVSLIELAAASRRLGPYQIEAAIAAVHAEATELDATDWPQIVALYDLLLDFKPSPVVRLNRAVALRQIVGPEEALAEVEQLASALDGYHIYHATRGELLLEMGERAQARAAQIRALELTKNDAERSLLRGRLFA